MLRLLTCRGTAAHFPSTGRIVSMLTQSTRIDSDVRMTKASKLMKAPPRAITMTIALVIACHRHILRTRSITAATTRMHLLND